MHKRCRKEVEFLAVYVREAHPTNGWRMVSNDLVGIKIKQPEAWAERLKVARECCNCLDIKMPVLVDDMDDRVGHAYSGMPDRLYLIDRDGRVAFKSGRGPFGLKPAELEQSLIMLLLDQASAAERQVAVPVSSDAEAWKLLPPAAKGAGRPLPVWARALARPLPRTTAAMLELDYLQRARSPLSPRLRGEMRWIAARANRCAYSEAYAEADLRRAGVDEADIRALASDLAGLPGAEKLALAFSRKMTLAADTVTDAEVAELRRRYGDGQVVAMVLLLAYANFQDRLVLTLNLPLETGGPLQPLDIHFLRGAAVSGRALAPPRRVPAAKPVAPGPQPGPDPEWSALDLAQLHKAMEAQRSRQGRIPVPSWGAVRRHLPAGYPADKPLRIRWSLVCLGYQPELAAGWSACTRAFGEEAKQDRAFEESLFWVVTRSLRCFY